MDEQKQKPRYEPQGDDTPVFVWNAGSKPFWDQGNEPYSIMLLDYEEYADEPTLVIQDITRTEGGINDPRGQYVTRTPNATVHTKQSEARVVLDIDTAEAMALAMLKWAQDKRRQMLKQQ
jgi:hypothetical protein